MGPVRGGLLKVVAFGLVFLPCLELFRKLICASAGFEIIFVWTHLHPGVRMTILLEHISEEVMSYIDSFLGRSWPCWKLSHDLASSAAFLCRSPYPFWVFDGGPHGSWIAAPQLCSWSSVEDGWMLCILKGSFVRGTIERCWRERWRWDWLGLCRWLSSC